MLSHEEELLAEEGDAARQTAWLEALAAEVGLLRKAVLRQGHAQELFQSRVEAAVGQLAGAPERARPLPPSPPPGLGPAQVRALLELDQALLQLLRLTAGADLADDDPRSLHEGLTLLQVRVRNLQHSLGLAAIPSRDLPFDDRWHEACGVAHRPDLPDRWVVEEILPGYRLGDRVVRPARVVVNRHHEERD